MTSASEPIFRLGVSHMLCFSRTFLRPWQQMGASKSTCQKSCDAHGGTYPHSFSQHLTCFFMGIDMWVYYCKPLEFHYSSHISAIFQWLQRAAESQRHLLPLSVLCEEHWTICHLGQHRSDVETHQTAIFVGLLVSLHLADLSETILFHKSPDWYDMLLLQSCTLNSQ